MISLLQPLTSKLLMESKWVFISLKQIHCQPLTAKKPNPTLMTWMKHSFLPSLMYKGGPHLAVSLTLHGKEQVSLWVQQPYTMLAYSHPCPILGRTRTWWDAQPKMLIRICRPMPSHHLQRRIWEYLGSLDTKLCYF